MSCKLLAVSIGRPNAGAGAGKYSIEMLKATGRELKASS